MSLFESITYKKDLDTSINHSINIKQLCGKSILVTGATGTVGSFVADMLLRYNQTHCADITVYVAGRNIERLHDRFDAFSDEKLRCVEYNLMSPISFDFPVEYVIHAAGNAHPAAFNRNPVETIIGNIEGTYNLLEYCRTHGTKRFLYVSSGEVYGQGDLKKDSFEETYAGYIDTTSPRSCYPESKRATENLCASYSKQYGLETLIVRLCHTYGPVITPSDNRANAQFFRNVLEGQDIVMKSAGTQVRSYNYVSDCVSAMLTVLVNGKSGEAYNVSNPKAGVTIAELAHVIAKQGGSKVIFEEPDDNDVANRTPIEKQVLSSEKIEAIGWKPAFDIYSGIRSTLRILREK